MQTEPVTKHKFGYYPNKQGIHVDHQLSVSEVRLVYQVQIPAKAAEFSFIQIPLES